MLKTAEELKAQAKKIGLTFWLIHRCSLCNYSCGFIMNGDEVSYNSGCDCVSYCDIRKSSWEELTKTYNLNQPESNKDISGMYLEKLNKIWQFDIKQ